MSGAPGRAVVEIDRGACAGARVCVRRLPRVFGVGEDGKAVVLDAGAAPLGSLVAAARECPRFAIRVEQDGRRLD